MNKKYYIVYHSADFDGLFSGLIILDGLLKEGIKLNDIITIGYNYQDTISFYNDQYVKTELLQELTSNDTVYFGDVFYTKSRDYVEKMIATGADIIVIDHHETSIEMLTADINVMDRHETGVKMLTRNFNTYIDLKSSKNSSDASIWENNHPESAALLCWRHFHKNEEPNHILCYISDYDIWYRRSESDWIDYTLAFQFGIRSKIDIKRPLKEFIDQLQLLLYNDANLQEQRSEFITSCIKSGRTIIEFNKERNKGIMKSNGFKANIEIDGNVYKGYIGCDYLNNSTLFEWGLDRQTYNESEIFILARPKFGRLSAYISIISNRDEIHAGNLCKSLGGGGHKKIGGCEINVEWLVERDSTTDELPTIALRKN